MSGFSLTLPEAADDIWAAQVTERFHLSVRRLCHALDAKLAAVTVTREGEEVALVVDGRRVAASPGMAADAVARRLEDLARMLAWPAILAPALASLGVAESWWLRHASLRGLTLGELAGLAEGEATEEAIAWRLADRFPPVLSLRAGERAAAAFADATLRDDAARQAAAWCGLPVPKPPMPLRDAALGPDEAAVSLGVLALPAFSVSGWDDLRSTLAASLRQAVPALLDPALALALVTDETRIPRRHAVAALARGGAVTIARHIAEAAGDVFGTVDLAAIVDATAGISPP